MIFFIILIIHKLVKGDLKFKIYIKKRFIYLKVQKNNYNKNLEFKTISNTFGYKK